MPVLTRTSIIKTGNALDTAIVVYGQYELLPQGANGTHTAGRREGRRFALVPIADE